MKKRADISEFDIYFASLKSGKHTFFYQIDSKFVKENENSLITDFIASIRLELDKQSEVTGILEIELEGKTQLECERCLTMFEYPFLIKERVVVKVDHTADNEDEGIIYIQPNESKFNIADNIYEYLQEAVPFRKTCDLIQKECNQEMIGLLSKYIIDNKTESEGDSRWESLKNLIIN